jgi:hypothetical protein
MPLGHLAQLPAPLCCGQGIALQPYPAFKHGARKVSKLSTSARDLVQICTSHYPSSRMNTSSRQQNSKKPRWTKKAQKIQQSRQNTQPDKQNQQSIGLQRKGKRGEKLRLRSEESDTDWDSKNLWGLNVHNLRENNDLIESFKEFQSVCHILTLGTQRPQLEQRIGFTWPRPCLFRPPLRRFTVMAAAATRIERKSATKKAQRRPTTATPQRRRTKWRKIEWAEEL